MKINQIILIMFIVVFISVLYSTGCKIPPKYSVEPQITYLRAEQSDTIDILGSLNRKMKFIFHVLDGDGDIGIKADETTQKDVFMTLYKKEGNDMIIDTIASPNYRYSIPFAQPAGRDKTLDADVSIQILFPYTNTGTLPYDTIAFEFYIIDRAGHKSNTELSKKIGF